ncbi:MULTISPECIES: hypothetical protein [unclassified Streptomyces]|uniref:hypothetical protein n=1 Tax=unclassified Streptomyces TaxID=2593676 RepID=UPI0011612CAA|nr:hypothetical protein [Streptomyces sp. CB02366]
MDDNRAEAERLANIRAGWHRYKAAEADAQAAVIRLTDSMRQLATALQEGADRDLAEHPDMAELNVMLDGFYSPPPAVTPPQ